MASCITETDQPYPDVQIIKNPMDLPHNLLNEIIFFEKNVDDVSHFAVLSLDLQKNGKYSLPKEGNQINLSPNNEVVTFIRNEKVGKKNPHRVWLYDLQTKQESMLAGWSEDMMDIWLSNPSFSNDSEKIIFTVTWIENNNHGLATVNIDGTDLRVLNTNLPLNEGAIYSPDGELIIVTCAGMDDVTGQVGFQLCLLNKNGLYKKHLTNRGDSNSSYCFTPNGEKIVYSELEFGGIFKVINKRIDRFIIMDADGKHKQELLNWDVRIHGFSDDSQIIIFEGRPNELSPWGIYIINIDGTNLRHLVYFDEFLEEWYSDIKQY